MNKFLRSALLMVALGLAGCGGGGGNEQKVVDQVTRSVYNNDMAGVTANFDSSLAPQVTRASVGALSDQMHQFGTYQGLTETATDIPAHRYTFDAKFDKGDMTVQVRFDPDGKLLAAYRVSPGAPH
jgi:hypothetical protein